MPKGTGRSIFWHILAYPGMASFHDSIGTDCLPACLGYMFVETMVPSTRKSHSPPSLEMTLSSPWSLSYSMGRRGRGDSPLASVQLKEGTRMDGWMDGSKDMSQKYTQRVVLPKMMSTLIVLFMITSVPTKDDFWSYSKNRPTYDLYLKPSTVPWHSIVGSVVHCTVL